MSERYFTSSDGALLLDGERIQPHQARTPEENHPLRMFARFMANDTDTHGSVHEFAPGSPLAQLNQGTLRSVEYAGRRIELPDIESQKKQAYAVFDDARLSAEQARALLRLKAGLDRRFLTFGAQFNLLTLMLPAQTLAPWQRSDPANPVPLRILAYTYPRFREAADLGDPTRENLRAMIRLNLLTVCFEARRQRRPLPFLVNPPGAFLRGLAEDEKNRVAQQLSDVVEDLRSDVALRSAVGDAVSEWILLIPSFWKLRRPPDPDLHLVQADIQVIAEELWRRRGVECPIPMMGDPAGAIGNGALGNFANSAVDEFLFRLCGGTQGLVGSVRYHPDLRVLPVSEVVQAIGRTDDDPS